MLIAAILNYAARQPMVILLPLLHYRPNKVKGKGKDVDLYSAFHAPGTPNALTSLKLTHQTAI